MKKYNVVIISALVLQLLFILQAFAQLKNIVEPDLLNMLTTNKIKVVNRSVSKLQEGDFKGVHLDERANDGVAWLEPITFTNGIIECDIRGKDKFQESFVGIAFNGQNDETYEGIYFRPFNFRAPDPNRRSHAVQYIYHPEYTWKKLRTDFPDVYENAIAPAPDPNEWFHVRVVVDSPQIRVYVNHATMPSLEVKQLSNSNGGKIGFWVGNLSAGDFANLKIIPAKKL